MPRRDDFNKGTREHLARSVNYHCSKCGAATAGPFAGGGKSISTGVAAHISAAAPGGPRYDPSMTTAQRRHYDNGIYLCAAHAPLVDLDWPSYTVEQLREMKRLAEAKAAADLEYARAQADLRPLLDGPIRLVPPRRNESRPGYERLFHAVFSLSGVRKQRGRAYIEIDDGAHVEATPGCISRNNRSIQHEWRDLRPAEPYLIPVFTTIEEPSAFWLDSQFLRDESASSLLSPGVYVTDDPFLHGQDRQALAAGDYRIRVRLVLGDSRHRHEFRSDWQEVSSRLNVRDHLFVSAGLKVTHSGLV